MKREEGKDAVWFRTVNTCLLSIFVLASLILVGGCAQKEIMPTSEIPADFTTFTDETGLYSISYPQDWEPALSQIPDLETAVKDIITSIESDAPVERASLIFFAGIPIATGYAPNVNIVVDSLPGVATHDQMVEAEINGIKQMVKDYHEVSRVKTTVDGREATIIDLDGTYPQIGQFRCLLLCVLIGKTAWVVACTPPSGEFRQWEEDFQAIVRSLRIMK